MAYSEAHKRAAMKYEKNNYKRMLGKVPLKIYELVQQSELYKNDNNFLNTLILEQLKREGLLDENSML